MIIVLLSLTGKPYFFTVTWPYTTSSHNSSHLHVPFLLSSIYNKFGSNFHYGHPLNKQRVCLRWVSWSPNSSLRVNSLFGQPQEDTARVGSKMRCKRIGVGAGEGPSPQFSCVSCLAKFAQFSQPLGTQTKTNPVLFTLDASYMYICFKIWWFIVLFTSVVIDWCNYFSFFL